MEQTLWQRCQNWLGNLGFRLLVARPYYAGQRRFARAAGLPLSAVQTGQAAAVIVTSSWELAGPQLIPPRVHVSPACGAWHEQPVACWHMHRLPAPLSCVTGCCIQVVGPVLAESAGPLLPELSTWLDAQTGGITYGARCSLLNFVRSIWRQHQTTCDMARSVHGHAGRADRD